MVADALKGDVERIIAITADTDLGPAIRMVAASRPECEVFVAAPPRRLGKCRALLPKLEITQGRIAKCLLPASVQVAGNRVVTRPAPYDPPA
jgi:hypothetical protein